MASDLINKGFCKNPMKLLCRLFKLTPLCKALHEYLEYPDGSMRFPTVRFYFLTLEIAMQNAHHDEPGFWDKWAENF
jgi:hypothetical protein